MKVYMVYKGLSLVELFKEKDSAVKFLTDREVYRDGRTYTNGWEIVERKLK